MKKKMCEKERQTDERETEEREDLPVAGLLVQIAPTARWAGSQVLKVAGTQVLEPSTAAFQAH